MERERDAMKIVRHIKERIMNLQGYGWREFLNENSGQ